MEQVRGVPKVDKVDLDGSELLHLLLLLLLADLPRKARVPGDACDLVSHDEMGIE